uniref:Uncharacterized protein n=4 Tax=Aegilops tauschii subsp. strangulata TaxID=200361 RepID=A0A452XM51_AEGTS|nr:WEB family protein At4g27595, chloroplastic-like [Aegilops tauschii subsp. strangulata]
MGESENSHSIPKSPHQNRRRTHLLHPLHFSSSAAAMVGEKTRELELKKIKKMRRGSPSFTPPPSWIHGGRPPSTTTEDTVRTSGQNRDGGCRLPTTSIPSRRTVGEDEVSEDETDEDDEDESDNEVEYFPSPDAIREGRTKRNQDPAGVSPTTRATKRARVEAEQQASPPPAKRKGSFKVITQKPRKAAALPRMWKPMPDVAKVVPSPSFTNQATENTKNISKGTLDTGVVSTKVAREVNPTVELGSGHEQARNSEEIPPSPSQSSIPMDTAPDKSPSPPEIQSGGSIQTPTAPEPISPSTMAVKSPRRNETPSISSTSFSLARSLEDKVGAGKEAMLQAEQMETQLKELLISNETLKTNIRKTCELGAKYLGLQKELEKVRQELDEEQAKTIRLEKEKIAMEESVKKTLEEKDTSLAKARAEADAMTKKADDRLEELQEAREMNDNYLKAAEDMKKQIEALKASESEWHTKYVKRFDLVEMTKMKYEKDIGELKKGMSDTETFLVGQLDEVKQRLEVFCPDPIMEDHKVQKELEKVRQELDEEQAKTIWRENEKTVMEEFMKKTLEEKNTALAKAREEADAMTKKADDRLEELQEVREMNDNYLKAAEDMKKQIEALKASESEWHTKYVKRSDLAEMTKMKYEKDLGELKQGMSDTETFLVGQLDEVKQRLEVFCPDPIMEDHKVQKELEAYGIDIKETPWASTQVAEAVIRLGERAEAAKSVIAQVRKSMKGINATLHPGEEVDEALPICLQQLEQVPDRVSRCKKSAARCGANVALALTRVHFPEINEAKLQNIGVGNPEGDNFEDHMKTFIGTANQIAPLIVLDLSVEPASVPDTSEEELVQEEEKNK